MLCKPFLSLHVPPCGSLLHPGSRLRLVLRHPLAVLVQPAEVVLRGRVSLVGGLAVPARRLGAVLPLAYSREMVAKVALRIYVSLVGGFAEPAHHLGIVTLVSAASLG